MNKIMKLEELPEQITEKSIRELLNIPDDEKFGIGDTAVAFDAKRLEVYEYPFQNGRRCLYIITRSSDDNGPAFAISIYPK